MKGLYSKSHGILMMIAHPEGETRLRKDHFIIHEQIAQLIQAFLPQLEKMMRAHIYLHTIFLIFGFLEILSFFSFFHFFAEHSLIAFVLALLFLTAFSYFILRLYSQTRKTEQLKELKIKFGSKVKTILDYEEGSPESHSVLGDTFCKLAQSLDGKEYHFYKTPKFFSRFETQIERFSYWSHWHDIYAMKEIALIASVEEQIKLIKCEATSLEAHTALANVYILLSSLYMNPRKQMDEEERRWIHSKYYSEELQSKFKASAESAIEEFKILCHFAPNDPWVHEQLAYSYCDLDMPLEAIVEYEQILKLNPGDPEILYKLGILYFQLGRNSLGLHIYEQLKHSHYKKAEMLITHYGSYSCASTSFNKNRIP